MLSFLILSVQLGNSSISQAQSQLSFHREQLRIFLPETTSSSLNNLLHDPSLIIYTSSSPSASIPPAYQITDNSSTINGLHSPFYNISADSHERATGPGNPNKEFPWSVPGGTDRSSNIKSIKFLKLPNNQPIVYYSQRLREDSGIPTILWTYPKGTIFGEVLTYQPPISPYNRHDYPFELRIRTKTATAWEIQVWKPFPTLQHLIRAIGQIPRNLVSLPIKILRNRHPRVVINIRTQKLELPQLPPETVHKLMAGKIFEEATNQEFYNSEESSFQGQLPSGPVNEKSDFHIIPRNYDGYFLGNDVNSCTNCHDSVAKSADFFDLRRDWYGRVRGSDGIFSFHIFDNRSISYDGGSKGRRINQELISNRILEQYNPQRHPREIYFYHPEYKPQ